MKRLRELCDEHGLSGDVSAGLADLLRLLASDPAAPTSVSDPARAVDAHIADSLSALPWLPERGALADVGSGAGLPGVPLALARPACEVDLLEANGRKCRFIAGAIERLALRNARAVCMRAEEWAAAEGAERYTAVTARAVAPLAALVEYASPLLHDGGVLIAWKGVRDGAEERRAVTAAGVLGMSALAVHRVTPFAAAEHRHLHLFRKTGPTPPGVPRRPGMARKRPFGRE